MVKKIITLRMVKKGEPRYPSILVYFCYFLTVQRHLFICKSLSNNIPITIFPNYFHSSQSGVVRAVSLSFCILKLAYMYSRYKQF